MTKNLVQALDFLDLAKAQIRCGKEKMAIETLEIIVKDLKDFVKICES